MSSDNCDGEIAIPLGLMAPLGGPDCGTGDAIGWQGTEQLCVAKTSTPEQRNLERAAI